MKIIQPKTYIFISIAAAFACIAWFFAMIIADDFFYGKEFFDYISLFVGVLGLLFIPAPALLFFYGLFLLKEPSSRRTIIAGLVFNILFIFAQLFLFYISLNTYDSGMGSSIPASEFIQQL